MTFVAVTVLACTTQKAPPPEDTAAPPVPPDLTWPSPNVVFNPPEIVVPEDFGTHKVFLSAGHGTGTNVGNIGCRCQLEQDFTLRATHQLADQLKSLGVFKVSEARTGAKRPTYGARLRKLHRSKAEVMVELHSDYRGSPFVMAGVHESGEWCMKSSRAPGLAVLVSDEGSETLAAERRRLARAVARALWDAGFTYFDGYQYGDSYDGDEEVGGVYLDRRGLMMLRRPKVPSILIETHNAVDPNEVSRWDEPATQDMFFRAVTKGLVNYFAASN
ncbi:MAG: N-acetylmuramoyl-L-alanine amidase [Myxococcota bacterium]